MGFSFGAKDAGLAGFLDKTLDQMQGLTDTSAAAKGGFDAALPSFEGWNSQLSDLGKGFRVLSGSVADSQKALGSNLTDDMVSSFKDLRLGLLQVAQEAEEGLGVRATASFEKLQKVVESFKDEVGSKLPAGAAAGLEAFDSELKSLESGLEQSFGKTTSKLKEEQKQATDAAEKAAEAMKEASEKKAAADEHLIDLQQQLKKEHGFLGTAVMELSQKYGKSTGDIDKDFGEIDEKTRKLTERFSRSGFMFSKAGAGITSTFSGINEVVGKMNQLLQVNKLQGFIQALSLGTLSHVRSAIEDIGEGGLNLTTNLEAQGVAASKSARQVAANLGLEGKAMQRVAGQAAGMSIGMNIGAETATQALVAWTRAQEELRMVGITSAAQLAKLAEVAGINAIEFSKMLVATRSTFKGMKPEQLSRIVGSFQAMGSATGDVSGGLAMLPEMMELVQRRSASLGARLMGNADAAESFATQTAGLAAGFGRFSGSAAEARTDAMELATAISANEIELAKLSSGVGTDMPALFTEAGIATGDFASALEAAKKGPAEFVAQFTTMVAKVRAKGGDAADVMKFMGARLEGALGEKATKALIRFADNATDADKATVVAAASASSSLGKYADASWSSGRTLAESYQLAQDSAEASFRAIGNARGAFVRDSAKEFGEFVKMLKGVAAEGGPMGKLVTLMSDMHSIGAAALLPETLRPMAAMFSTISKAMMPVVAGFAAITFLFGPLGGAAALVAAAIGLISVHLYALKEKTGSWTSAIQALCDQMGSWLGLTKKVGQKFFTLENILSGLGDYVSKFFESIPGLIDKGFAALDTFLTGLGDVSSTIPWKSIWEKIFKSGSKALKAVGAALARLAGAFWKGLTTQMDPKSAAGASATDRVMMGIGRVLQDSLVNLWDYAKTTLVPAISSFIQNFLTGLANGFDPNAGEGKSASDTIGIMIGGLIRTGLNKAIDVVKSYMKDWWAKMGDIWSSDKSFGDKVKGTFENSGGLIIGAFAIAKFLPVLKVFGMLSSTLSGLWTVLSFVGGVVADVVGIIGGATAGIIAAIAAVVLLTGAFVAWPEKTKAAVDKVKAWMADLGKNIGKYTTLAVLGVIDFIAALPGLLVEYGPAIAEGLWKALVALEQVFNGFIAGIARGVVDGFREAFPQLESVWSIFDKLIDIWEQANSPLTNIQNAFKTFALLLDPATESTGKFGDKLEGIRKFINDRLIPIIKYLATPALAVFAAIGVAATFLWEAIKTGVYVIYRIFYTVFNLIWNVVKWVWDQFAWAFVQLYDATIKPYVTAIGALFKWLWDSNIKPIWDPAFQWFSTMFDSLWTWAKISIDKVLAIFRDARAGVDEFFGGIDAWVDKLFRNSIHTDVAKDMEQTVEAVKASSMQIVTFLQNALSDAILLGITNAFTLALKKSGDAVKSFTKDAIEQFDDMMTQLKRIFKNGFAIINSDVAKAVGELTSGMSEVMRDLDSMARSFGALAAARSMTATRAAEEAAARKAEGEAAPGPRSVVPDYQFANLDLAALKDAVNNPQWVEREFSKLVTTSIALNGLMTSLVKETAAGSIRVEKALKANASSGPRSSSTSPKTAKG